MTVVTDRGTEHMTASEKTTEPVASAADPAWTRKAPSPAETAPVPLRRNKNFQLLWTGSVAAFVGLSVADIAYPLAILAMTRSPFRAGLFATVQLIAMMLLTLPVGQLLDRVDRRRALLFGEGLRTVVVAGVAAAYIGGVLNFWELMAAAVALGAAQPFGSARMLMVRTVVPEEQLTTALTQEQVRNHGSELVGPPLGGALFAASRALPFVFCAAMTLMSFVCALFVKLPAKPAAGADAALSAEAPAAGTPAESAESAESADEGGALAGLKIVLRTPLMRATALTLTLVNMVGYPLYLCLIVLMEHQGSSSRAVGFVVGAMAAGGLAGTLYVKPLHRLFRPGWLLIAACAWFTAGIGAVAVLHTPVEAATLMFLSGLPIPAAVVMINMLILQEVPDEQRGRTNAALQTLMAGGMPLGMLTAGVALQYLSPRTTLVALAAGMAAAALYAASQRALRAATWPGAQEPRTPDADAVPAAS